VGIWNDQVTARAGLKGVLVRSVADGGPAAAAGIRPTREDERGHVIPGDLIVAVNGKPVRNSLDLYRLLDQYKAGDAVELTVQRDDGEKTVRVTLGVIE
jgi:S1-C subfamily serine protease